MIDNNEHSKKLKSFVYFIYLYLGIIKTNLLYNHNEYIVHINTPITVKINA
jgi:hypothetical protein